MTAVRTTIDIECSDWVASTLTPFEDAVRHIACSASVLLIANFFMTSTDLTAAPSRQIQTAELKLDFGRASMQMRMQMTPSGVLAVGGLVSGILLSVTALVWVATSARRGHPVVSALRKR